MASQNEVYRMIGRALIDGGYLDSESSIGQGSSGMMYLRLRDQVFQIEVKELQQFNNVSNPSQAASDFMKTLPYPYTKTDEDVVP